MSEFALTIAGFTLCAGFIFFSGRYLSKYGDIIADHLGLGKAWIGMVLLASVTSLPELTVGISSVTIIQSADLAVGDVLGSCAFNLLILSLLDLFVKKKSLLATVSGSHILAASMSIILITLAGAGIFLPADIIITPWIGLTSIVFIVVYLFAMRMIYKNERKIMQQNLLPVQPNTHLTVSLKKATALFILNAAVVLTAAIFLPGFAESIAKETGLGESFVGTLFLAASTSFPEVAVSLAAVRLGLIDMAVGNLLGSNIFNIVILSVDDLLYAKGHLLKDASDMNLISVFSVVIMTAIAIAGLNYHNTAKKRFFLAADTLLILLVFIINLILLYNFRTQ